MLISLVFSIILIITSPALSPSQIQQTHQCVATTKKGTRCKNKALKGSNYCQVHQAKSPNVAQCKAQTKSGTRCSRAAKYSGYCKQHYDMYKAGKL